MLLTEYHEAEAMERFGEDGWREGRCEGRKVMAVEMHREGVATDVIARIAKESADVVERWLSEAVCV